MNLPWHARNHQDALDGMLMLTLEERGAYNTCLDLIYSRRGPIPDDPRWLSGWMGVSVRRWAKIRASLLVKRKLYEISFNGVPSLMNQRAANELENQSERSRNLSESGAKGGRKSAETRKNSKENNHAGQAPLEASVKLKTETYTVQNPTDVPDGTSPLPETTPTRAKSTGTYLSESWVVSEALYEFGQVKCAMSLQEIDDAADEFRDYWRSRRDARARHADWDATFRNRLREVAGRLGGPRPRLVAAAGQPRGGGRGPVSFADIYARRHGSGQN